MLTYQAALDQRRAMQRELNARDRTARRKFLAPLVTSRLAADDVRRLDQALARALWVRERFQSDFAEGKRALSGSITVLDELRDGNRRFAPLVRDLRIMMGNLCSLYDRHDEALQWYQGALAGEKAVDRRALALLNIARIHINRNDLHGAVQAAQRVSQGKPADERVQAHLALVRAKALLLLGFESACLQALTEGRCLESGDVKVRRDAWYLRAAADLDWHSGERTSAGYAALVDELARLGLASDRDFYELESALLAPLLGTKKSRSAQLARARHLARVTGQKVYLRLLVRTLKYLAAEKTGAGEFAALRREIEALARGGDLRLAQVLSLLWARRLIERRQYKRAAIMLNGVAIQWERLEAGFPMAVMQRLKRQASRTRSFADEQAASLPATEREEYAVVGQLLLSD